MRYLTLFISIILFISTAKGENLDLLSSSASYAPAPSASTAETTTTSTSAKPDVNIEDWDYDDLDDYDFKEGLIDDDPLPEDKDSKQNKEQTDSRWWWDLFKKGQLKTSDTTVVYPKFLGFCMDVYRWADKTFNSYDTTYVVGTGRRWKVRLLSDNWVDSYSMNPGKKGTIRMMSNPYANLGAYIQYMAVSLGYSVDIKNFIGHKTANHKKFEYSFNCARFNIEGHYWENTGGSYIRSFGDYKKGKFLKVPFEGVSLNSFEVCGYYFFNNKKYSYGAAYSFSKYQRKSAGSAIIGFGLNSLNINLDFSKLPSYLLPYLVDMEPSNYRFHYNSYSIMSGYSYNWVIHRNLLFNISAFPGIGLTHTYADSSEGHVKLLALNIKGLASLTYNIKDLFLCAIARMDGDWYRSNNYSFFSSVENVQVSVGYRF